MNTQPRAACYGSTEQWTPDLRPAPDTLQRLQQVCAGCAVARECGLLALQINAGGMWAGVWVGDGPGAHAAGRAQLKARYGGAA